MDDAQGTLAVRFAVRSDIGLHRADNEDSAYAGARLLAVADGMGGHAGGEVASAAVIEALRPLDTQVPDGELLNALEHAVRRASSALREIAATDASLRGMGTTLTALLWSGSQLGLVHIGDSRAYLVRDGEVFQITHDHTMVQSLLDDGKITAGEVATHPQRSLLLRALDGGHPVPDLQLREARLGDRYLLSSDGLHAVVAAESIAGSCCRSAILIRPPPDLIALAIAGGGPDNITCIVADVVTPEVPPRPELTVPRTAGLGLPGTGANARPDAVARADDDSRMNWGRRPADCPQVFTELTGIWRSHAGNHHQARRYHSRGRYHPAGHDGDRSQRGDVAAGPDRPDRRRQACLSRAERLAARGQPRFIAGVHGDNDPGRWHDVKIDAGQP